VSWGLLLAAAFGGGVIAWLLDLCVTSIRTFETARLLLVAELTMIASVVHAPSQSTFGLPLPTSAWETQRHVLARRIAGRDKRLWAGVTTVYSSIVISSRLSAAGVQELDRVLTDLRNFPVGPVRGIVAYGFGFLLRRDPVANL
jgi:hypothetical protein